MRVRVLAVSALCAAASVSQGRAQVRAAPPHRLRHEIIAVYVGSERTDAQSGMIDAVRDLRGALVRQSATTGRSVIMRGVSLAPTVSLGMRHLSLFSGFDEVSVGGNWTNSAVLRYLGNDIGGGRGSVPQLIILERDVEETMTTLHVSPEREIARFNGVDEIGDWVHRGAPLPH